MNIGQLSITQPFLGMRLCAVANSSRSAYGCIVMVNGTVHAAPTGALLWWMVRYMQCLGVHCYGQWYSTCLSWSMAVKSREELLWLNRKFHQCGWDCCPGHPHCSCLKSRNPGVGLSPLSPITFTDVCALPAAHTLRAGLVVLESCFLYHYIMFPNNSFMVFFV